MIEKLEGFRSISYVDTAHKRTVGFGFNMDTLYSKSIWSDLKIEEDFDKVYDESQLISRDSSYILFNDFWKRSVILARTRTKELNLDWNSFPDWKKFVLADIAYNTGDLQSWRKVFIATDSDEVLFQARRKQKEIDSRIAKIGYHYGLIDNLAHAKAIGLSEAKYL